MFLKPIILSLILILVAPSEGYRILCVFPFNGRSHQIMYEALCKKLATRGHQIDMISHFPLKKPLENYTDIVNLEGTLEPVLNSFSVESATTLNHDLIKLIAVDFGGRFCHLMGHEKMKDFMKNPPKYDLVITEFFGSNCFLGLGHYLKAPAVGVTSTLDTPYIDDPIGNPLSTAFFSNTYFDAAVVNGFWDRLMNTVWNILAIWQFHYYSSPQTQSMRKYLGEDVPDIRQVEKSVSLVLVNTYRSFHGIRPLNPALVEVGGLHIEEDESRLTPELEKWLDSSTNGVVYFTLGSLVDITTLPEGSIRALYASFAKIAPTRVLIKIVNKDKLPPGLPNNVFTLPWMPQIPVLRHKNVRAFITHGGLSGSLEALYYGVPVIGMPVFNDQFKNVNIFVHKGMGVLVDIHNITENALDAALSSVLNDPSYRESARRESALFKDRPMSPMNTAIYWIEYVIRNGRDSLRSPAVDLTWWQRDLLDVYAFLVVVIITLIYGLVSLLRALFRRRRRASQNSRRKKIE